jgi:hypothetical protein
LPDGKLLPTKVARLDFAAVIDFHATSLEQLKRLERLPAVSREISIQVLHPDIDGCGYQKPHRDDGRVGLYIRKRPMVAFLTQQLLAIRSWFSRRARLEAENLFLGQQLIVLRRTTRSACGY